MPLSVTLGGNDLVRSKLLEFIPFDTDFDLLFCFLFFDKNLNFKLKLNNTKLVRNDQ